MSTLRDIQENFSRSLRAGAGTGIASRVLAAGIDVEDRLQIYRNNVRANFLVAMQATYPLIERLGGSDWFAQSVQRYQAENPSRRGDLQYVGEEYARFLQDDLGRTEHGYFVDVARLEWAYQEVLTAASSTPFEHDVLGTIDEADYERIVFVPRAALRLVESRFPLMQIWRSNQPGADLREPIHLDAGGDAILVIRRTDHIELRQLRRPLVALLRQWIAGVPLGIAVATAAAESDDFDFSRELTDLLAMQVIAAIHLAGELS